MNIRITSQKCTALNIALTALTTVHIGKSNDKCHNIVVCSLWGPRYEIRLWTVTNL